MAVPATLRRPSSPVDHIASLAKGQATGSEVGPRRVNDNRTLKLGK